jgi:hypothetical protein
MKRWALLTSMLYLLCLSILTVPLFMVLSDEGSGLLLYFYIYFVPILLLVQAVLLLVPIAVIRERPVKRRKIVLSAVIGAIPMAVLALGFFGSIALIILGEDSADDYLSEWPTLIILAISWLVWGIVFYKSFSTEDPNSFTSSLTSWFLRGSILELLVAIPSHIISRHRDECCAPPLTLFGIASGLAIALMSFGPGVLFLFARKIRDKNGGRGSGLDIRH